MTILILGIALVLGLAIVTPWLGAKVDKTIDELFDDLG